MVFRLIRSLFSRTQESFRVLERFERDLEQSKKNDVVRAQLRKMGDDGTRPRHVIHFAYESTAGAASTEKVIHAVLQGFIARPNDEGDGVIFEETREVASVEFDDHTETISQELATAGWDYDGWECAVVEQKGY